MQTQHHLVKDGFFPPYHSDRICHLFKSCQRIHLLKDALNFLMMGSLYVGVMNEEKRRIYSTCQKGQRMTFHFFQNLMLDVREESSIL